MMIHRPHRQDEALRDLGVGESLTDQLQHVELARGESGRVGPGRRLPPAWHTFHTLRPQRAADPGRQRNRAEIIGKPHRGEQRFLQRGDQEPRPLDGHRRVAVYQCTVAALCLVGTCRAPE
jgi:hypothetical protein